MAAAAPWAVLLLGALLLPEVYLAEETVYLDVGSNIGVQVRKLFEPEKFPGAEVHPVFEYYFGKNRSDVCAVGVEPTPKHTPQLVAIQDAYNLMGWETVFLTRTAAHTSDGIARFLMDPRHDKNNFGSSLVELGHAHNRGWKEYAVRKLDLAKFITEQFHPDASIVMKLDIEGAEYQVVPALLTSGVLCRLKAAMIEWHPRYVPDGIKSDPTSTERGYNAVEIKDFILALQQQNPSCGVAFLDMDDESFMDMDIAKVPLPEPPVPGSWAEKRKAAQEAAGAASGL